MMDQAADIAICVAVVLLGAPFSIMAAWLLLAGQTVFFARPLHNLMFAGSSLSVTSYTYYSASAIITCSAVPTTCCDSRNQECCAEMLALSVRLLHAEGGKTNGER